MDELLLHYACVFMGVLTERVMEKIFSKLSDTVEIFWTVLHIHMFVLFYIFVLNI